MKRICLIYWMKSSRAKGFATYEEWYEHIREYTKQMKLMALSKKVTLMP